MDWNLVIWSAVIGGFAGLLAFGSYRVIVSNQERKSSSHTLVAVLLFGLVNSIGYELIIPNVRASKWVGDASKSFDSDPMLAAIAQQHPEVKVEYLELMEDLGRRGVSQREADEQAMLFGSRVLSTHAFSYLLTTSDAALTQYAETVVDVLEEFEAPQADACHYYLFGGPQPPPNFQSTIRPERQKQLLEAMTNVIVTAVRSPQSPIDEDLRSVLTERHVNRLSKEFGPSFDAAVLSLNEPNATGIDRVALCSAMTNLYRSALQAPSDERTSLLRALFAAA